MKSRIIRAIKPVLENLERRQLMTVLEGGQVGYYAKGPNEYVKVEVSGGGALAFVGSSQNSLGAAQLNDIPMTILDAETGAFIRNNLGGVGGRDGIAPIAELTGTGGVSLMRDDDNNGNPVGYYGIVPSEGVAFDALASNTAGRTYAVNRRVEGGASDENPAYDVVVVNNRNGRIDVLDNIAGKLAAALQADAPSIEVGDLGDLIGADFDPSNPDVLYIGVTVNYPFGGGSSPTENEVPALFSYNIRSEAITFVNRFGANSADDDFTVSDFTFLDNNRIAFFGSVKRDGDDEAFEGLFITNKARPGPDGRQVITLGFGDAAEPITDIAAMEAVSSTTILIVTGDQQMIRVDLRANGGVIGTALQGGTVDPDQPEDADPKRGQDIRDITFNPKIVDNGVFDPGKKGVLIGTDAGTDELVGLDLRQRFLSSSVYAIYDKEATTDTSLSMTVITPSTRENLSFEQKLFQGVSNPYGSSAGQLATLMTDPGQESPQLITLNNGGVYIGGRSNDDEDRNVIPSLSLNSDRDPESGNFAGTLPGIRLEEIVSPGIYLSGSIRGIYIAGTITGRVAINGSVDRFYAGNVITGNPYTGSGSITTDNFSVGGDLRNLFVAGGIGKLAGSPGAFEPRTDFSIGGRVHQIRTGLEFRGAIDVSGKVNTISNRDLVLENETVVTNQGNNVANAFDDFQIANQGFNRNDGFDAPQILGSISDKKGRGGQVTIVGSINNGAPVGDNVDTYGLPLLAGEGAVIQLIEPILNANAVQFQVIDPAGRIYYTNQSNQNATREDRVFQDSALSINQQIKFTADKPGLWRIAIIPTQPDVLVNQYRPYQLAVSSIGFISLGGLSSTGSVVLSNPTLGVQVRSGDLGAIFANNEIYGAELGRAGSVATARESTFANPIITKNGSIRTLEAGSISHLDGTALSGYPTIISSSKIGLIHADDRLYINRASLAVNVGTSGAPSKNLITKGDIQVVEAGGNFSGVLATNGSIGVIRAGSIDANTLGIERASYFYINFDSKGGDELGLIDSAGDIGNFSEGGPSLFSGAGGNIKYIRAGGDIYRDRFFGFGSVIVRRATNESITINDDTGVEVSVKPITGTFTVTPDTTTGGNGNDTTGGGTGNDTISGGGLPDPFGGGGTSGGTGSNPSPFGSGGTGGLGGLPDPFGGGTPVIDDPEDPDAGVPDDAEVIGQLQLDTYPVRSGGFIITRVISSTGVTVATKRAGGGGVADISTIITGDRGTPLTVDEDGNLVAAPTVIDPDEPLAEQLEDANRFLDVILVGNSRINVLSIGGSGNGTAAYTRIDNFSDGEIVNINALSAGVITGEWLGVTRKTANVNLEGLNNVADSRFNGVATLYPFNQAKNMIFVSNASTIAARGPLGNITIKERVQNLIANAGNKNVKGVLEGIVAPVMVYTGQNTIFGRIDRIDIGEGLGFSGSGETSFAGLYSTDNLGLITNLNGSGDIRGDIVVDDYLQGINLTGGGSIIDADIYQAEVGADARQLIDGPTPANGFQVALERINIIPTISVINDTPEFPVGIGKMVISGAGGIMNARVLGYNIGKITLNRGSFGVLTSDFISETGGSMGGITADGLGIRYVSYRGGSYIGDLIATGNGTLRSVTEFSRSVRGSESGPFDGSTGIFLNMANDLHRFLGTSKNKTSIVGVTNDGVIEDSLIEANRSIRTVRAHTIRIRLNPREARPRDETYPMQINTGGELGLVTTSRSMEGLRIVSGTTGNIEAGFDIKNFQLQTTGYVNRVSAKRNFLGTANLNLTGGASLNQFQVGRNLTGTAYVARGIRSIVVGGNFGSPSAIGGVYTPSSINQVLISGDVSGTGYLRAKKVIKQLVVGGDVHSEASVLARSITSKRIGGDVDGNVT